LEFLHTAGVQHDADPSANGLRWQIASESAPHDAVGSVVSADLAPVHAEGAVLGLGDEGHLLAQVEVGGGLVVAALDFDETDAVVLRAETALVPEDGAVHVQTRRSLILRSGGRHDARKAMMGEEGKADCGKTREKLLR
jgi:hypothetical protein